MFLPKNTIHACFFISVPFPGVSKKIDFSSFKKNFQYIQNLKIIIFEKIFLERVLIWIPFTQNYREWQCSTTPLLLTIKKNSFVYIRYLPKHVFSPQKLRKRWEITVDGFFEWKHLIICIKTTTRKFVSKIIFFNFSLKI